jgi:hypothetical protein
MKTEKDYLLLLNLLFEVADSLEEKKYPDPRFHDCNKLALKLFAHAATVYYLRQGTKTPVPKLDGSFFYDFASVAVITRSALDTYLNMFELFFDPISDDEREFRYTLWFLSGFALREDIIADDPTVVNMRNRIQKTLAFSKLKTGEKKIILLGKRQNNELKLRIDAAGFGPKTFRRMNTYLSSYVHSDGLSAVQIMGADTLEKQIDYIENYMNIFMMIMAKMILEYKKLFPSAEALCLASPEVSMLAEFWEKVARGLE